MKKEKSLSDDKDFSLNKTYLRFFATFFFAAFFATFFFAMVVAN